MNFGEASDPRILVDLAGEAEHAGWDGFFLTDALMYHQDGHKPVTDTFTGLAAVAAKTSRIRIGTAIAVLPRRSPWQVARETVAIDQLSNGRLILGVGIGGETDVEYGKFGDQSTPRSLGEKLDESLDVITGLWTGEGFSYHGRHYRVDRARFTPRPVQKPRIPIWIGGSWPNKPPFRRAERWDGMIPIKHQKTVELEPRDLPEIRAFIEKHRETTTGHFDVANSRQSTVSGRDRIKENIIRASGNYLVAQVHASLSQFDQGDARTSEGSPTLSLRLAAKTKRMTGPSPLGRD